MNSEQHECANCGALLAGPYCAQCGQKVAPLNPPLRDVLHEVAHEVLSFDNRLLRSTRQLLTAPGFLTFEYFAGRRARYVSPLRLYLIFSVLYFAVAAFAPNTTLNVTVTADDAQEAAAQGAQTPEQLEQRRAAIQEVAARALVEWVPRVMFVLVPVFAALIWLAARRSGRNYPQHLYFALHVHAAWFAVNAVAAALQTMNKPVVTDTVVRIVGLYFVVYLVLALRRAYQMKVVRALLSALLIGLAYALIVALSFLAIVLPALTAIRS